VAAAVFPPEGEVDSAEKIAPWLREIFLLVLLRIIGGIFWVSEH
jgi:hypothetical protein